MLAGTHGETQVQQEHLEMAHAQTGNRLLVNMQI